MVCAVSCPCAQVPHVAMNPPLELIQTAINQCAKKVLTTSKVLPCWGQPDIQTYHELIASDKEIVKSILRLTGSVEGVKSQVSSQDLATDPGFSVCCRLK